MDVDLDTFLSYRQDPQVARFQGWSTLSQDQAVMFIREMQTAVLGQPGEWFQIAIAHQTTNQLLGDIGLQVDANNPGTVEIGFTLMRTEQGKGYAQEAVQALIDALFEWNIADAIVGITDQRNEPSIRLLQRLGLRWVRSAEVEFRGEWCVEDTFELDKKNWIGKSTSSYPPAN